MSTDLIMRRTHLYLGLALLPWFTIYGVSSIPFSHPDWFKGSGGPDKNLWQITEERPYEIDITPTGNDRAIAAKILRDVGMEGGYGVWRPPGEKRLEIHKMNFVFPSRVNYYPEKKRLVVEEKHFRWGQFLTGMHARGGFNQDNFLNDLWAVFIDIVCLSMFTWIGTGLYLWWKRRPTRMWGWLAIGSGGAAFAILVALL